MRCGCQDLRLANRGYERIGCCRSGTRPSVLPPTTARSATLAVVLTCSDCAVVCNHPFSAPGGALVTAGRTVRRGRAGAT